MRRRGAWARVFATRTVLVLAIGYAGLCVVLPGWLATRLHQLAGDALTIGQIRLGFPLQVILLDVRLASGNPGTVVSSDRIIISPVWLSWPDKVVWLRQLDLQGLRLQFRRTRQGILVQPAFHAPLPSHSTPSNQHDPPLAVARPARDAAFPWRVAIQTLHVSEGTVEFVDENSSQPFRGALTHLFLVGGPLAMPLKMEPLTLAVHGHVVGHQQHEASVYCSGWMDLQAKNVDASCQLEPLRLAAFEPYYQGPAQMRYDATLKATGHLVAKANALDGRVQLEVGNLSDADLAFLGKTLGDAKKLVSGSQPALTGEIQLSGSLDQPLEWRFQLVPGNEIVQHLVKPLLDRGIEIIRIKVGKQTIPVGLMPATEATKADSEAAKQHVQEALQLIAPTSPPAATPEAVGPSPQSPAATPEPPRTSVQSSEPPSEKPAGGRAPSASPH